MSSYDSLFARVTDTVTDWRTDLEADREWIEDPANAGVPYIHVARPWGTDIVGLYPAGDSRWPSTGERIPFLFGTADREHILRTAEVTVSYRLKHDEQHAARWHYWNGCGTLREISGERALAIIRQYVAKTLAQWAREARHGRVAAIL